MPLNYLTGKKYGKLTVLSRAGTDKKRQATWNCICDCGKECIKVGCYLVAGETSSCGCVGHDNRANMGKKMQPYHKLRAFAPGEAAFNALMGIYKRRAKHGFELSKSEFKALTQGNCVYCGQEPAQQYRHQSGNGPYIYNGVDRVDSSKGYTLENTVPCCGTCNRMKLDHSHDEFLNHIKRIINHVGGE